MECVACGMRNKLLHCFSFLHRYTTKWQLSKVYDVRLDVGEDNDSNKRKNWNPTDALKYICCAVLCCAMTVIIGGDDSVTHATLVHYTHGLSFSELINWFNCCRRQFTKLNACMISIVTTIRLHRYTQTRTSDRSSYALCNVKSNARLCHGRIHLSGGSDKIRRLNGGVNVNCNM